MSAIEFSFIFEDPEHDSMFILANGFDLEQLNSSISADLNDNKLLLEIPSGEYARAFVRAFHECRLSLDVAGILFRIIHESIEYGISEKMALIVKLDIDPLSAKIDPSFPKQPEGNN